MQKILIVMWWLLDRKKKEKNAGEMRYEVHWKGRRKINVILTKYNRWTGCCNCLYLIHKKKNVRVRILWQKLTEGWKFLLFWLDFNRGNTVGEVRGVRIKWLLKWIDALFELFIRNSSRDLEPFIWH